MSNVKMICPKCRKKSIFYDRKTYYQCGSCGISVDLDFRPIKDDFNEPTAYDSKIIICPCCGNIMYSKGYTNEKLSPCDNCGYTEMINTNVNGVKYTEMQLHGDREKFKELNHKLRELYTFNSKVFDKEKYEQLEKQEIQKEINKMLEDNYESQKYDDAVNKPHCPTCNSTNVSLISTGKKITGGLMFGLFSRNVRNTYKCNNCGYKW